MDDLLLEENIDTSLDNTVEHVESQQEAQKDPEQQEYGQKVQKRISQLTWQKEQERREKEILKSQLEELKSSMNEIKHNQTKTYFETKTNEYKDKIKQAHLNGDIDVATNLNDEYLTWISQNHQANTSSAFQPKTSYIQPGQPSVQFQQPYTQPANQQVSPDFIAFQARNDWYGINLAMTNTADQLGTQLSNDPNMAGRSYRELLNEVEKRVKNEFKHKFQTQSYANNAVEGIGYQPQSPNKRIVVTQAEIDQAKMFLPNRTTDQIKSLIERQKRQEAVL